MATLSVPPTPRRTHRDEPPKLSFAEHLEELRRRLGISLAAFVVAVGVCLANVERIIRWLQHPAQGLLPRFVYFTPTEPLIVYLKVSAFAGLILSMPILLSQLWGFVRAGLTPRERSYGVMFIAWGSALFVAGVAFAYYGLLPVSLQVLLGIGRSYLEPLISIDQYLSFVTTLCVWCGVIFELPMLVFVLAKIGIVTAEWLRQQRPYAILVLVTIAAIVTPTTDPVNLLLMSAPMLLLYELSLLLVRCSIRRHSP